MIFPKMMTKTIFGQFISRKSNDKVLKNEKKHFHGVVQAWTFCFLLNQKHLWRYAKFSEGCKVVFSFTKTIFSPQNDGHCPISKTRHLFRLFYFVFLKKFPEN